MKQKVLLSLFSYGLKKFYLFFFITPFFILLSPCAWGNGTPEVTFVKDQGTLIKGKQIAFYKDSTNQLSIQEIRSKVFSTSKNIPNFRFSKATYWLRLSLKNEGNLHRYVLRIANPNLDSVTIYIPQKGGGFMETTSGLLTNFDYRKYQTPDPIFPLPLLKDSISTIFLKVQSKNQVFIPVFVGGIKDIYSQIFNDHNISFVFLGIFLIMIIYNLFLYLSTKEKNYLLYTLYLIAIVFTQLSLKGVGYQYLWHDSSFLTNKSIVLSGAVSGILTILFTKSFLELRKTLPLFNKVLNVFIILDVVGFLFSFISFYFLSYQIINAVAVLGCLTILIASLKLIQEKNRPAMFFFLAYSFFLIAVILYVLRLYSVLPFNLFTRHILLLGSSIEVALLSFSLADKINQYRKEKDISHKKALRAAREKELFIGQQNRILEGKVQRRTKKLQRTNEELNISLNKLKEAQSQLVNAEKMASLGRLTAGIAHEINNPVNFIQSNIRSLELDIEDLNELLAKYKEITKSNIEEKLKEIEALTEEVELDVVQDEIPKLLVGMKEGTTRTTEIVNGLRTFSRLDENIFKDTDLHQGIDSTLHLLKNILPGNLKIKKEYGTLPFVECNPGKINQVFMNLLTNAIQATESNKSKKEREVRIETNALEKEVMICIADNGPGIPKKIQDKMFEPFFTTKEVGEGTGLGLSLVFSIIQKHNGTIHVDSQPGKGTQFCIILPIQHKTPPNKEVKD